MEIVMASERKADAEKNLAKKSEFCLVINHKKANFHLISKMLLKY